jgi:hypothetical protein
MRGFDDYLSDLRAQLQRCAAEAAPARGGAGGRDRRPERAPAPRRLAPRRALALAAALAVGAGALGVGLLAVDQRSEGPASPNAMLAGPGGGASAYVEPVAAGLSSPAPGAARGGYGLAAIAELSPSDVWSVGAHSDAAGGSTEHSFALHFDGTSWRETPVPDVGPLTAVGVAADGEAWALGPAGDVVHWDGVQWQVVLSAAHDDDAVLRGLAVLGTNAVWAVGSSHGAPYATHWNGAGWRAAVLPVTPGGGALNAVAGTPTGLWAVGVAADGSNVLTMSYDGATWSQVADAGVSDGGLLTVAATSSDDVWAAGDALLQHYDGSRWLDVSQAFSGVRETLAAPAPASVWLGGAAGVARYDGTTWRPVTAQEMGVAALPNVQLGAVAAQSPTDVWIAGTTGAGTSSTPLVVHWDGASWHVAVDTVASR